MQAVGRKDLAEGEEGIKQSDTDAVSFGTQDDVGEVTDLFLKQMSWLPRPHRMLVGWKK